MKRFAGIIGQPVAHSLSPVFQEAAFIACGLDVEYQRWDTPADALPARVDSLRAAACLGANVTIPHKEAVIPLLDELGGQSARIGAVNTIVNREGRLFGFNTDGSGFVAALRAEKSFEVSGTNVLLVGAGGAARGIAFALAEAGAARLVIWNRTASRADRLASDVAETGYRHVSAAQHTPPPAEYDLIVNSTSIGMVGGPEPGGLPLALEGARPGTTVVDIVYAPEETPLLTEARCRGLPMLGGLPMLIYQGALAFELFTGVTAPVEVMFAAARNELSHRKSSAS